MNCQLLTRTLISRTHSDPINIRVVELVRNVVGHGDAWQGRWRGNYRMEWVASTLTPPPNVVYPALLKLMRTPRLPAVDWTDAPTDLNELVRFGERRNLVSARVPSRSERAIHRWLSACLGKDEITQGKFLGFRKQQQIILSRERISSCMQQDSLRNAWRQNRPML